MIYVRLYSTLRKYHTAGRGDQPIQISYFPLMTIRELLKELGIDQDREVSVIAVNGEVKGQNYGYTIQDGDRIDFFGFISGG